ncbi:hypothetical protein CN198_34605 [Sinorhizobium meliloti]|nr:hypothetical protein CN198_34605 [Sinorhizobium meliloti]RVH99864.1 hypothetical protein CN205_34740 [Sinorhizobium meliloti]RVK58326.1 hypothetical protein CN159_34780 [Sinorhizobium meliloti]RVO20138.1 hypothetical protein CN095_35380 [Sinorhizobium meliloti]
MPTIRKSIDRYRREGLTGLHDRSSGPQRSRRPTPAGDIETIERLRRQPWTGKKSPLRPATASSGRSP